MTRKRLALLSCAWMSILALTVISQQAYAAEQHWPGGCEGTTCVIGGSGKFCITNYPGVCGPY
jgi:hypothetical protein